MSQKVNLYASDLPTTQPGHAVIEEQTFIANNLGAMFIPSMYAGDVPIEAVEQAMPYGLPMYARPVPITYQVPKARPIPNTAMVTPTVRVISNPNNAYAELIRAGIQNVPNGGA